MQQLQAIFQQRNADIDALKLKETENKKQQFLEKERNRIQRENWILKVIKSVKQLKPEQKKNIYAATQRMMSYFNQTQDLPINDLDLSLNFTQQLINIFVQFYRVTFSDDLTAIKKIIRPNNAYIVIDLIKLLVETHRQLFRVKIQETYRQSILDDKNRRKVFKSLPNTRREIPSTEQSMVEETKKQVNFSIIDQRIKAAIYEKTSSFLNSFNLTEGLLKDKINDTFIELLERNQNNGFYIKKFQQKCMGKPKGFCFKVQGLYTQQQIQRMEKKNKNSVQEKFSNIQQLRGNPTPEQLKEYFKIKVQIQQGVNNIQSKKKNISQINWWFPIITQRSGNHYRPLNVLVNYYDKELIPITDLNERCGISLKNYLRILHKKNQPNSSTILGKDNEGKHFKRYQYLDINQARTKELMTDLCRVYSKEKKQSLFPLLRSTEIKQENQRALRNKSLTQCKLAPLFKNDIISKKLETKDNNNQSEQPKQPMSVQLGRASNSGKILREYSDELSPNPYEKKKSISKVQKSRIDDIIQSILNQRNMTASN